jgi:DNA adenine methylase
VIALDALPTRPALRYHGGKWRLASWILGFFPPHEAYSTYVECYGGSFAVGLQKQPSRLDVWNDRNREVLTFFTVLREREDELLVAIERTPYHEDEARNAERIRREARPGVWPYDGSPSGDMEVARLLYVCAWQTYGGVRDPRTSSGYRFDVVAGSKSNVAQWCEHHETLRAVAARMRQVQFHDRDALEILRRYAGAGTVFYVDPPYVSSTRERRWATAAYAVETDDAAQRELAAVLHEVDAAAILLSGYPCPLYDELYAGWRLETRTTRTQGRGEATEALWIAPPVDVRRHLWHEKKSFGQVALPLEGVAP